MKIKCFKFGGQGEGEPKFPLRAHYNDSGADCFAAERAVIPAGGIAKVRTGVGVEIPDGYDMCIHCKSGLASKGIWAANCPIDSGYRGEIYAVLMNAGGDDYVFEEGDKVGQFVVRPVVYAEFCGDPAAEGGERGAGGFGSTGR